MTLPIERLELLEADRVWGGLEGRRVEKGTLFAVDATGGHHKGLMSRTRAAQLTAAGLGRIVAAFIPARYFYMAARAPDLERELRFARKTIRLMKRETNEFDEGRAIANKALRRLDAFLKEQKRHGR